MWYYHNKITKDYEENTMGGLFDLDNKVMVFLGKLTDLLILNLLFLATCIPIFTIGAALASLYEVTLKMAKNEESYMIKGYLGAFKSNFKKSTGMWLVIGALFLVLFVDIYISMQNVGVLWDGLLACAIVFVVGLFALASYIFPLQAKFDNTFKNTLLNAFVMSIKHLPTTIMVVFMNCFVFICMIFNSYTFYYGILAYTFLGFSVVAYMNSVLFVRVFEKYYDAATEEQIECGNEE